MAWAVLLHPDFAAELNGSASDLRTRVAAAAKLLMEIGPNLGRPRVDHLKGSQHRNMKEFRFNDGTRVAFAFDPERVAILLVGANKAGVSETLFYSRFIRTADERFTTHLSRKGRA